MNEEIRRLITLFSYAAALVEKELLRATSRQAPSTARQKRERLAVVTGILATLRAQVIGTEIRPGAAWSVIEAAYREGSVMASRDLVRAGRGPVDTSLGGIHLEAARTLYESLVDDLDGAIAHVGRKASDTLRKVTLSEILTSQIAGRSQRETSSAIAENLRSRGIEGFTDSRGRGWSLERYARMAAHTTAHEAQTTASLNRYAEAGIDLVQVSFHASSCQTCKPYERKVYSISGTSVEYPALEVAPPYHPFCRHVLTAYIEGLRAA